jgi:hypothetical protein
LVRVAVATWCKLLEAAMSKASRRQENAYLHVD